jgi:HSP20 family protein
MESLFRRPSLAFEEEDWFSPEMDVAEDDKSITIRLEAPGLEREKIKVTLENGVLTVSGNKEEVSDEKKKQYHIRERRFGTFSRQVALPEYVNPEKAEAAYNNGVLEIHFEKIEEAKPKSIEVKVK